MTTVDTKSWEVFVAALPPRSESEYFRAIVHFVLSNEVETTLECVLGDSGANTELRFASLYGLLVLMRRRKNFTAFAQLIDTNLHEFKNEPVMQVLRAEALAFDSQDVAKLTEARRLARIGLENFDRSGARLLNAEICLKLFEAEGSRNQYLIDEATDHISIASSLAPRYPKILALRGRIRAHQGRFAEAYADVFEAIDSEDSGCDDYPIRVMDHQMARMEVTVRDYMARIQRAQTDASEEFGHTRRSILETLGLLAAVIAFLTSSAAVSAQLELEEAVRYSIVSAGAVLMVFAGFSLLVSRSQQWARVSVAIVIAVCMCVGPLWL